MSDSKKSNKKELKTVNLDDLRSSDPFEELDRDDEIIIETGVSLKELDSRGSKSVSRPSSKNSKSGEVSASSDEIQKNKEKQHSLERLKILDDKRSFDRKVFNWKGLGIITLIVFVGVFFDKGLSDIVFKAVGEEVSYLANLVRWFFSGLQFLGDYYPLIALASLIWIPIKKNSQDQFTLSFDGIIAPTEVGTNSLRKRSTWASIKKVDFGKSSGAPVMRLLNENDRILGELRLDIDDPKSFHQALSRFAPQGHPVRKLINN